MRSLFVLVILICSGRSDAQAIASSDLLARAIAYHDPSGGWSELQDTLYITMSYPDGVKRHSTIEVDIPKQYFKLTSKKEGIIIEQTIDKGECALKLNGSTDISQDDIKEQRLTCERAETMKNYYLYLYGLPMKLKDPGTKLDPQVQTKSFKGKEYLVLKATYDENVGKDTWYFYFDPSTYAMEAYQFYHDESKNDGEYIMLSEIENVFNIKMPKVRAWYTNEDDRYLGTDTLTSSEIIE